MQTLCFHSLSRSLSLCAVRILNAYVDFIHYLLTPFVCVCFRAANKFASAASKIYINALDNIHSKELSLWRLLWLSDNLLNHNS